MDGINRDNKRKRTLRVPDEKIYETKKKGLSLSRALHLAPRDRYAHTGSKMARLFIAHIKIRAPPLCILKSIDSVLMAIDPGVAKKKKERKK